MFFAVQRSTNRLAQPASRHVPLVTDAVLVSPGLREPGLMLPDAPVPG